MTVPLGAREALLIEAIGEVVTVIESANRMTAEIREASSELHQASEGLRTSLAGFEAQILALTERAKFQAMKHIVARTDEAAQRSIEIQSRAMADAARVAFGADLGATMQRLQSMQARPRRGLELWVTHVAAAATASAATWTLALMLWAR